MMASMQEVRMKPRCSSMDSCQLEIIQEGGGVLGVV
jgi:hypothetical protein